MSILKKYFLFFLLSFGLFLKAEPKYQDFVREIRITGIGQIKMEYKYTGEPVSKPAGLSFWIKCGKSKSWTAVGKFLMCDLTKYEYESVSKKITIQFLEGRVEPKTGEVICDRLGEGEIDAKTLCK